MGDGFTVAEIKRMLQRRCPGLLHELVPGARREGRVLSAPNPTRSNDKRGSFKIWPNGAWREYDEDEQLGKGDLIGLIAYVNGFAPKSTEGRRFALDWARDTLGLARMTPAQRGQAKRHASRDAEAARRKAESDEARAAWRKHKRARDIFLAATPLDQDAHGDRGRRYLEARGIDLAGIADLTPGILRLHPRLMHWASEERPLLPALVAGVMAPDVGLRAVHCTFLAPDGRPQKADVVPAKLMLGAVKGAFVPLTLGGGRLTIREAIAQGKALPVVLCEGIETGLSIALVTGGLARVWACLSLGNIAHAPVHLPCVESVIVAIENDTAAQALAQREAVVDALERVGKPLSFMRPHRGVDHNDLLMMEE